MFLFTRKSGILIPTKYKKENFYIEIKSFLTRKIKLYNTDNKYTTYEFFIETEDDLLIPRFFPIEDYLDKDNFKIINKISKSQQINISHNITPRRSQLETIDFLSISSNGIVQLPPGSGKTLISIHMIAEKKKKSLILVHKDALADQWKNRFLQFTNLKEEDIVRLSSQNYHNHLKKPIIISTVQTLLSLIKKEPHILYNQIYNANIGIFVGDEIHTSVGAPLFSLASLFISSEENFGLSATPSRGDGTQDILNYHLGEIFIPQDKLIETMEDQVEIKVFLMDYGLAKKSRKFIYPVGKFERARYFNLLRKSEILFDTTVNLIKKLYNDNRNIIMISERINFIEMVYSKLDKLDRSKFIGSADLSETNHKIVLGTPTKLRDGIDLVEKDTLIMTSPITNIEQVVGRITRTFKDKQYPLVFDFVDIGCRDISGSFFKRHIFYKDKKWKINYFSVLKDDIKVIDEEMAFKIIKIGT